MNKSEIVERLKDQYKDQDIKLYSEESPRKIGNPDEKLTTKAYKAICDMWNCSEGSRKFVKYMVYNFLPVNPGSQMMKYSDEDKANNINRCCVLRIKLAGLDDVIDFYTKFGLARMAGDFKAAAEHLPKLPKEQYEELKKLRKEAPIEVKNATVGYVSQDGKKYISGEALTALEIFTQDCLLNDEKEIAHVVKTKMAGGNQDKAKQRKEEAAKQKAEVEAIKKKSLFNVKSFVDDKTLGALEKLKSNLK